MREKSSSVEGLIDYNGITYLVRASNSEGILNAVVTLKDAATSGLKGMVDDGLRDKVERKVNQIEEAFFKKPPYSMSRCIKYYI